MQFFHSNNLLLLGLFNLGFLVCKVVQAVRQLRFVDLPKCSLTQFFNKFCPNWGDFVAIQYLYVLGGPEKNKD